MPPPALFSGLFDDAAVFPPGNFPIDIALARRMDRSVTVDARYVGPLLAPPSLVEQILRRPQPVDVVVIGRPGADLEEVLTTAQTIADDETHSLAGVQVARQGGWEKLISLDVPIAIELSADDHTAGLDSLVPHRFQVLAKLRTGATPSNDVPTPAQLAGFITDCHQRGLTFKLTGGMHRAISHGEGAEREFGFLNVLAATQRVIDHHHDIAALLDERDTDAVLAVIGEIDEQRAHEVRALFQSYGCCDVDHPINDLRTLALIEEKK